MPQTLFTAADLAEMDGDFELDRGHLAPVTGAKLRHGTMQSRFDTKLREFVERHDLGEVFVELGCWIETDPDTVRIPDVAFVRWERLQRYGDDDDCWYEGPPDLAVEVTGNRGDLARTRRRIDRLTAAGCPLLWHAVIPDRTVTIHAAGHVPRVLRDGDVLGGGDLLPGFAWPVADIFRRRRQS